MRTCNHGRCRKRAVIGFRPYKDGYDITATRGMQYRCELHGRPFMKDGKAGPYCFDIKEKV